MDLSTEYIAGFFDGEGTVGIYSSESNHVYRSYILTVSLGQIEPSIVTYLKERYGGSIHFQERSKKIANRQDAWYWRLSGQKALAFLKEIAPFSIVKKSQILLAFEYMDQRLKPGHTRKRSGTANRDLEFCQKMKDLKRPSVGLI